MFFLYGWDHGNFNFPHSHFVSMSFPEVVVLSTICLESRCWEVNCSWLNILSGGEHGVFFGFLVCIYDLLLDDYLFVAFYSFSIQYVACSFYTSHSIRHCLIRWFEDTSTIANSQIMEWSQTLSLIVIGIVETMSFSFSQKQMRNLTY